MVYDTKKLEEKALKEIKKKKLYFIDDIATSLGISRTTFYAHDLDKLDTIKVAMLKNKSEIKLGLRSKWYESDNSTVQVALYKLLGDEEECHKLNGSKQVIDATNKNFNTDLDTSKISTKNLEAIASMSPEELINLSKNIPEDK